MSLLRLRYLGLIVVLTLPVSCGGEGTPVECGGDGRYHESDVARYCAYGVIVGGFSCPAALPFAHDVALPGGDFGAVCSDRAEEGALPRAVCEDLGAAPECVVMPQSTPEERPPLPQRDSDCAAGFPEPTAGSLGGIRLGRPGASVDVPLEELSDGDSVPVFADEAGDPALAFGLQVGDGAPGFRCYLISFRYTFPEREGLTIDAVPGPYLVELSQRLPVVHALFGPLEGSLHGEDVQLQVAVRDIEGVEEMQTISLRLEDVVGAP